MRVVVTGGSGFIGSHVVDSLVARGHETCIYDLDTPQHSPGCEHVRGDARDLDRLVKAVRSGDVIYHLAAEANVNRFFESPLFSNENTSHSTLCVLEAARRVDAARVVLASTEWVYGSTDGNEEVVIAEDCPYARDPDHIYTCSKIAAELFCIGHRNLYGTEYTIMRYGIPFGERARPETVTPTFIRKILKDETIRIHGDGSQYRQFIYVKDLAEGNVACLQESARNQIFNLNGTEKVTVLQVVQALERILGRTARIEFVEDRKGNFKGRFISSEKAKHLLGWEPRHRYEEALSLYASRYLDSLRQRR
ncbi:MAG: epimerase [Acidobacteria bacterium]|jgi:UDP-glucose 4-epimerase|nr:epimerase [Acidobacteriota bacterium]